MWYIRLKQTRVNPILTLSYFKKRYIRIEYFLELCVVFFRIAPETRLLSAQHTQYMRLEQAVYVQNRLCIRTFKGVVGREHANHVQIVRIQNEIKTFWAWVSRSKYVQLCNTFFHYWQRICCEYEILQSQLIRIGYTDKCDRAFRFRIQNWHRLNVNWNRTRINGCCERCILCIWRITMGSYWLEGRGDGVNQEARFESNLLVEN